jgi:CBS domain-containing protein
MKAVLVEKIMTSDVEACLASDTLSDAAAVMWRRDCGAVPVVDEERRVVGVVTDRDICMALATRGRLATEVRVGDVMTAEPRTCTSADDVREALDLMRSAQLRRLPVVDGAGRLAGILSINDIILHSDRGKSKKHVSHRSVMATLKAISAPHPGPDRKSDGGGRGDDRGDRDAHDGPNADG